MLKINEEELKKINQRTKIFILFFTILFSIIFSRLAYLQIFEKEHFQKKAIDNVTKEIKISPKRGIIYDRNGKVIADNKSIYVLQVLPEKIYGFKKNKRDSIKQFFKEISFLNIEQEKLDEIEEKIIKSPSFRPITILEDISEKTLSEITYKSKYIDGLSVNVSYVRNYPHNDLFFSLLGYVGKITKEELKNEENNYMLSTDYIGKTGLEKYLNKELYGEIGIEKVMINANGKVIYRSEDKLPINGKDIRLTVDYDLQKIAKEEFEKIQKKGAIVAMNVKNGDILAFYSNPSYDANKFVKGISKDEYKLLSKGDSPLLNRVIQGQYPPASTIKPYMSIAALEGDFIDPKKEIFCGPDFKIGNQRFRDWKKWGHGKVDMVQAIARSVDVYYYKLAVDMGIDYIYDFLKYFGYGREVQLPFAHQSIGLLPSNKWKMKTLKEPFYAGEIAIIGIGQGNFMVTPIQMLNALSILLNYGDEIKMNFLLSEDKKILNKFNFNKSYVDIAKDGMKEVMNGDNGTSRKYKKETDFTMAGKTGTAQVFSTKGEIEYENEEMPEELRDHGLFIGFAPYEDPEIAIAIVVEHGSSGNSAAAPIAVALEKEFMRKKRLEDETIKAYQEIQNTVKE